MWQLKKPRPPDRAWKTNDTARERRQTVRSPESRQGAREDEHGRHTRARGPTHETRRAPSVTGHWSLDESEGKKAARTVRSRRERARDWCGPSDTSRPKYIQAGGGGWRTPNLGAKDGMKKGTVFGRRGARGGEKSEGRPALAGVFKRAGGRRVERRGGCAGRSKVFSARDPSTRTHG